MAALPALRHAMGEPAMKWCSELRPQRVAVFRALQLGDMLCAVPALRALRDAWPKASITLIGLPWAESFVSRYSTLVDNLLCFPGARGFPEQEETDDGLPAFYLQARKRHFDVAIQLHGSGGPANDILFSLGARWHGGFVDPRDGYREGWFLPWPDTLPEPERYLALLRRMGIPARDKNLWFPLDFRDQAEFHVLAARHGIAAEHAVIVHPGSQLPSRRWPAKRFAEVADELAVLGAQIVLTGTRSERALIDSVRSVMHHDAIDLSGATSLGGLAALIKRVSLVVCNDTGVSHLAAAMRTPSVVIACGSDIRRWAPRDKKRHRLLADHPSCRPCVHHTCPMPHHVCALNVPVSAVLDAAAHQSRFRLSRTIVPMAPVES